MARIETDCNLKLFVSFRKFFPSVLRNKNILLRYAYTITWFSYEKKTLFSIRGVRLNKRSLSFQTVLAILTKITDTEHKTLQDGRKTIFSACKGLFILETRTERANNLRLFTRTYDVWLKSLESSIFWKPEHDSIPVTTARLSRRHICYFDPSRYV